MSYEQTLQIYNDMVATIPEIKRKGKANPYTSMNGNMFTFLSKDGKISLRLPKAELQLLMQDHGATPSIQYGAVMREYTELPQSVCEDTEALLNYFRMSVNYAKTLKPKPTKKSK